MAHQDVVPSEPGTEEAWSYRPVEGEIADRYIWGRGAMDDKSSLVAILEAVETRLERGFRPKRTVLLVFGHDEEVGGTKGAAAVAELLKSRGGCTVPAATAARRRSRLSGFMLVSNASRHQVCFSLMFLGGVS